ncbi:ribonuclease P protein component [Candidatus Kaiserbacteria bacterium RIFCSPLOWO2_12_FULL_53_8]|uniref:Ribonuclease P protein component n=2 Tax=Candidatus Kaiseribacteriota TaxID=1752734 RepID=A0A1F6G1G5_9BACT|nr:MAG: ribonuclease P protein component [Candidatus Kaiserbacteria bacterium RIFCSPLOWO2_12_FULL_53_8]
MPKKYRLSRSDFLGLDRKRSRRVHGTCFSLTIAPLPEGERAKAAVVVPKKMAARAVDRNRIERRVREALRPLLARLQSPTVLVFHAKREAAEASFADTKKDIKTLLGRAGLGDTTL